MKRNDTVLNLMPLPATPPTRKTEAIARFVRSHPGCYIGHDGHGVTVMVEVLDVNTHETWTEYATALTMQGARDWLGY